MGDAKKPVKWHLLPFMAQLAQLRRQNGAIRWLIGRTTAM
jgi:hypothetical protein